ncbi:MAG: hypothetical protein NZ555_17765 [Geminicoccaceae bacterium]|nr:hypothetical protein [Geminicoccaceae bacterium]
MRLRTLVWATTLWTAAGSARAAPVRLDGAMLDAIAAGALRASFFTVASAATAAANGVDSRSQADATMTADRRSMSVRTTSRAGARLR